MKFQREQIPSRPVLIRLAIATEPLKRSFYSRRYKRNLDFHSSLCKRFRTLSENTKRRAFPFFFFFFRQGIVRIDHGSSCESSFRYSKRIILFSSLFYSPPPYCENLQFELIFKIVDRRLKFRGDCRALWEDEVRLCWWPVSSDSRLDVICVMSSLRYVSLSNTSILTFLLFLCFFLRVKSLIECNRFWDRPVMGYEHFQQYNKSNEVCQMDISICKNARENN